MELIGTLFKFANMSYIDVKEVQVQNEAGALINPAENETIILLRRIVQILQPISTQDANNRQRVSVDNGLNIAGDTIGNVQTMNGFDTRFWWADAARNTYANGIRQNLIFS